MIYKVKTRGSNPGYPAKYETAEGVQKLDKLVL